MELVSPDAPALWSEARRLIDEYAGSLGFDLAFQDFQHEIQSLPTEYGPPDGCFLLAREAGNWIGCGGVRRFSSSACEMKRLYVTPSGRGRGAGFAIASELIARARSRGYESMLLDTVPSMTHAQDLYKRLGFLPTEAYRHNPVPGASYWRLELGGSRE